MWINGSSNHKTSNLLDHASSKQHLTAMALFKKDQAGNKSLATGSPIARCLMNIDERTRKRMNKMFDLCYVMAREGLPFTKYPPLLELENRHGIDIGPAYKTDVSAKSFTHYIAESQRQSFLSYMSNHLHFFSFLMDGTTDAGNLEDELVVVQFCWIDNASREVKTCARYLSVVNPDKADTSGLVNCLKIPLERVGIVNMLDKASVLDNKPNLVGGGTDGASVNIGQHKSIKERFQKVLPWMFWSWCYAHRLELASKSGLCSRLFRSVEEMLLRLYYLYKKSPKKTRELIAIVGDLQEVFHLPKSGDVPICSEGSRWINHKRRALQRVIDRYGAYTLLT